jgi:hypothetical protein
MRVDRALSGGCAGHHPQPGVLVYQLSQRLPALSLGVLIVSGLVDDDEVKPTFLVQVNVPSNAVIIRYNDLGRAIDDGFAAGPWSVGYICGSVNDE